ncbi:mitochondrial fission regulator 2-like [Belonocnema kinseyi]|uniref:mitochondrial fission regulator 2-like n=1 Tax=Belonocnema kinseyi TaxID=2817044 RepID=UPI00143CDD61|nr:mitochondrial fission regulator 2-like [Belonocnema kinseyi]XP_033215555.1 mitochondrial fission regulator 2-like [Belonocnema kinseyi]
MGEAPKYYGRRRSIVRRIGSMLPLKPHPKIYVSVTPLHSMTSSMINEEANDDFPESNGLGPGSGLLSASKPDLLEPISFGSEVRLLALEQELQELREQISTIVKSAKPGPTRNFVSEPSLTNGKDNDIIGMKPPPPPPPLPPPTTPHIARRASLQDHIMEDKKKPPLNPHKSMGDILKDIDKVKLKPVARSPGGRPLKIKREDSPCNDLQEILRKRYLAMRSPDSKNSSATLALDDSFS